MYYTYGFKASADNKTMYYIEGVGDPDFFTKHPDFEEVSDRQEALNRLRQTFMTKENSEYREPPVAYFAYKRLLNLTVVFAMFPDPEEFYANNDGYSKPYNTYMLARVAAYSSF